MIGGGVGAHIHGRVWGARARLQNIVRYVFLVAVSVSWALSCSGVVLLPRPTCGVVVMVAYIWDV